LGVGSQEFERAMGQVCNVDDGAANFNEDGVSVGLRSFRPYLVEGGSVPYGPWLCPGVCACVSVGVVRTAAFLDTCSKASFTGGEFSISALIQSRAPSCRKRSLPIPELSIQARFGADLRRYGGRIGFQNFNTWVSKIT
jgi:hypothetical protein